MPSREAIITNPELEVQEKMLKELYTANEELVIFDIGACEGDSSIRYSMQFSKAKIFCFEPLPKNTDWIKSNISQFERENIEIIELCLSNQDGTADFFVSSAEQKPTNEGVNWERGNKSSSLLEPHKTLDIYKWLEFKQTIKVQTKRLDVFLSEREIRQIDFIHMDVQGAELMVLEGAKERMKSIHNIWLEVESIPLYKGQPLKSEVEKFLSKNGYVKIIDTVGDVAGDQFWTKRSWILEHKGQDWLKRQIEAMNQDIKKRRGTWFWRLRRKVQLRTKIKKWLGF